MPDPDVLLEVDVLPEDAILLWRADDAPEAILDDALAELRHQSFSRTDVDEIAALAGSGRYLLAAVPPAAWAFSFWHVFNALFSECLLFGSTWTWFAICSTPVLLRVERSAPAAARFDTNTSEWCLEFPETPALHAPLAALGAKVRDVEGRTLAWVA